MKNNPIYDTIFSVASWLVVVALLVSAVSIWIAVPSGFGPMAQMLGVFGSQVFYCVLYSTEAVVLLFAKVFKRSRLRKQTLFVIYLTGFLTSILNIVIGGWTPKLVDNLVVAFVAAFCWIYWTLKTEYINPKDFAGEISRLNNTGPPRG